MCAIRLIQLIENHSKSLARAVLHDIETSEHTRAFRKVPREELEPRVARTFLNLGKWIGNPNKDDIRQEYEDWGRTGFREGIPFREIVFALMLVKKHLRQFIKENGLINFSGDRVTPEELVPVQLYAIQELNYQVGDFFDRALYCLVRGHEAAAQAHLAAV